jgi:hypothetical protein
MAKRKVGSQISNFDSRPLKIGNRPDFLVCRQRTTYCWKDLDQGYNFASNLIAIRGLHKKLCALKVARVQVVGIWMWPPWRVVEYTIRGKVVVSPSPGHGEFCVSELPWLVLAPKML